MVRTYTEKEAIQRAVELAKKDIKSKVDEDAIIKDDKILHQEIKNGKVILDIHFKISGKYSSRKTDTQGDS